MQQQELGFIDRDKLISQMCLPKAMTVSDGSVSAQVMRFVLFRINQHLNNKTETFVGAVTIAEETGYGINTVYRAIEALEQLGAIKKEVKRGQARCVCSHYSVNWWLVSQMGKPIQHPELAVTMPVSLSERPPTEIEQPPTEIEQPPTEIERPPTEIEQPPTEIEQPPTSGVQPLDHGLDHKKTTIDQRGFGGEGALRNGSGDGLPSEIPTTNLKEPHAVEKLWQGVRAAGALPDTELWRRAFFAACHAVCRVASIRDPGGCLRYRLQQFRRRNHDLDQLRIDDAHDGAWAVQALAIVDGKTLVGSRGHVPSPVDRAEPVIDRERQQYGLTLLEKLAAKGYGELLSDQDIEQIRGDPRRWLHEQRERFPRLFEHAPRRRENFSTKGN